ncbi:unnamed protein product [Amoebophrya sp. A25]|nr:unnamed protein product [Amoebophrya sp. A25]|eukprot:GSA25T00026103001.1
MARNPQFRRYAGPVWNQLYHEDEAVQIGVLSFNYRMWQPAAPHMGRGGHLYRYVPSVRTQEGYLVRYNNLTEPQHLVCMRLQHQKEEEKRVAKAKREAKAEARKKQKLEKQQNPLNNVGDGDDFTSEDEEDMQISAAQRLLQSAAEQAQPKTRYTRSIKQQRRHIDCLGWDEAWAAHKANRKNKNQNKAGGGALEDAAAQEQATTGGRGGALEDAAAPPVVAANHVVLSSRRTTSVSKASNPRTSSTEQGRLSTIVEGEEAEDSNDSLAAALQEHGLV